MICQSSSQSPSFAMQAILFLAVMLEVWGAGVDGVAKAGAVRSNSRYGFYRSMGFEGDGAGATQARRMFGGNAAPLTTWGAVCALLDRYWAARCSGSVVAPRWVLTAAHCVSPRIAYVKYNARQPSSGDGNVAPVHYLYRHPEYKVKQEDEGRGMDVTLLHHDVGLVRTRTDMRLTAPLPQDLINAMTLYDPLSLANEEVEVLGFGRTERSAQGEELFTSRLVLSACGRGGWLHCVCGLAREGARSSGVCAGDSGGPVVYRGVQIGVTSMGPMECAASVTPPDVTATSVFTALRRYAPLINATITDMDSALRMSRISRAPSTSRLRPPTAFFILCFLYLIV